MTFGVIYPKQLGTVSMENHNLAIAQAYYTAMSEGRMSDLNNYLHPDVWFVGPLGEMTGKQSVIKAANNIASLLQKPILIRAKFCAQDQVMLAYDWFFAEPIGKLSAAVLMTFRDSLITNIELFFDARAFEKK